MCLAFFLLHAWINSHPTPYFTKYCMFQLQSNPLYDVRSRWHNIVIPDINLQEFSKSDDHLQHFKSDQHNPTINQGGSYIFFALEPNNKYEVRIQAKNTHGWGHFSEDFFFSTSAAGNLFSYMLLIKLPLNLKTLSSVSEDELKKSHRPVVKKFWQINFFVLLAL